MTDRVLPASLQTFLDGMASGPAYKVGINAWLDFCDTHDLDPNDTGNVIQYAEVLRAAGFKTSSIWTKISFIGTYFK
jgi:hypothetical protein